MADEAVTPDLDPDDLESLMALAVRLPAAEREAVIARFCRAHPSEDAAGLRRAIDEVVRTRDEADVGVQSIHAIPGQDG